VKKVRTVGTFALFVLDCVAAAWPGTLLSCNWPFFCLMISFLHCVMYYYVASLFSWRWLVHYLRILLSDGIARILMLSDAAAAIRNYSFLN